MCNCEIFHVECFHVGKKKKNCDYRLVLCIAVSFFSLFGVIGRVPVWVHVCVRVCSWVCVSACVRVCLDKGVHVHVFCQWLWHSSSSHHLFYYPKLLNKHIIVPLRLSLFCSVCEWETVRLMTRSMRQRASSAVWTLEIFSDPSVTHTHTHTYYQVTRINSFLSYIRDLVPSSSISRQIPSETTQRWNCNEVHCSSIVRANLRLSYYITTSYLFYCKTYSEHTWSYIFLIIL